MQVASSSLKLPSLPEQRTCERRCGLGGDLSKTGALQAMYALGAALALLATGQGSAAGDDWVSGGAHCGATESRRTLKAQATWTPPGEKRWPYQAPRGRTNSRCSTGVAERTRLDAGAGHELGQSVGECVRGVAHGTHKVHARVPEANVCDAPHEATHREVSDRSDGKEPARHGKPAQRG